MGKVWDAAQAAKEHAVEMAVLKSSMVDDIVKSSELKWLKPQSKFAPCPAKKRQAYSAVQKRTAWRNRTPWRKGRATKASSPAADEVARKKAALMLVDVSLRWKSGPVMVGAHHRQLPERAPAQR